MKNKEWVTQQSYDHKRVKATYTEMKSDPEAYGKTAKQFEKKTVPGQALSVSEIMKRYERGRPQPQE